MSFALSHKKKGFLFKERKKMENKKEKKNLKKFGLIGLIAYAISLFAFSSFAMINSKEAKAEDETTHYTYSYVYMNNLDDGDYIWIDEDTDRWLDIVYIDNVKYENCNLLSINYVDDPYLYLATKDEKLYKGGTSAMFPIPISFDTKIVYVPYNDDFEPNHYYFEKYESDIFSINFIEMPKFIDYFTNTTYKGVVLTAVSYSSGYYDIYDGIFISNNTTYHKIRLRMQVLYGTGWFVDGSIVEFNNNSNSAYTYNCYLASVYYDNQIVYQINGIQGADSNFYLSNYYRWNKQEYRNVYFYGKNQAPQSPKYPLLDTKDIFETINYGFVIYSDESLRMTFNLFSLLIVALSPLFNLQVAQNITLGVLILVPIVAGIIIAIIKLVKR